MKPSPKPAGLFLFRERVGLFSHCSQCFWRHRIDAKMCAPVALPQIACHYETFGAPPMSRLPSLPERIPEELLMTTHEPSALYATLTDILRDTFDNDDLVATPTMTAAQVEGWDSMGNVRLFLSIEQEFGVRFNASEIGGIKNVGELVTLLQQKTGN
jgi:acyl carrier protein